jgi:UDP-N-acetylglucosamine--N-acetylmuramyl-(pentapeptide) pyrophosphoryl-undecaprenol N-acetylglucosamine transferase
MVKIAISGGGTGGHIYPAIAIAKEVLQMEPEAKLIFIGGKGRRESTIAPKFGFDFVPILVEGFPRRISIRWFKVALKVPMGFAKSLIVLRDFSPRVVVGTGGYVCGPVLLSALLLHIPILIQEQNAMPGITNRIMGRWADEIHIPFPAAARFFPSGRTMVTGNPIRPEIVTTKASAREREKLGLEKDKLTVSFLGGSQGASSINAAALGALKHLLKFRPYLQIIHQTGESDLSSVKDTYGKLPFTAIVQPYFDMIEDVYAATDLVVCRSGGMTIAEITARGLPAVLVPYPFAAGDEQTFNAQVLEKNGAAVMIQDDQLTGERLADILISLIQDRKKLFDMAEKSRSLGKPRAAREIARAVLSLASVGN